MSQPQRSSRSSNPWNPADAERLAQADRVIERERKRQQGAVERRKVTSTSSYRRRKGDR